MFGTSGIRGPVGETITPKLAMGVGQALGATGDIEAAVIGSDPRESGQFIVDGLSSGLLAGGVDVIDVGIAATPTVARSVAWQDADVGIAVTASHNPPPDNGIKLWNPSGQAFTPDQQEALEARISAEEYATASWDNQGMRRRWERASDRHQSMLLDRLDGPFESIPDSLEGGIVVDVGNGAGGVTPRTLSAAGLDVETLNAQPDGRFPGRPSEPTATNCRSLTTLVETSDAELGLAHDGDADRLRAVDHTGHFLSGDELLAVFAAQAVSPGDVIVAPVNTSLLVDDVVTECGGTLVRSRVGDVHVAAGLEREAAVFGGEPSGAWIWPAVTRCPDGPLAAINLVSLVANEGPLATLIEDFEPYPITRESFETDQKAAVMDAVAAIVTDKYPSVSRIDGVRVETDDGWFLLRASGTQSLVRLTVETRDADALASLHAEAKAVVDEALASISTEGLQ